MAGKHVRSIGEDAVAGGPEEFERFACGRVRACDWSGENLIQKEVRPLDDSLPVALWCAAKAMQANDSL